LAKFSGGTQGQLKVALKSLGLMDEGKPTSDLEALVDAYETPHFEPLLRRVLERTYPYVFAIDLMTATPTMLANSFKSTGAREDVSRKCRSFFLHAAKQAGVPLGNRILTGSVPRTPSNGVTKRRSKTKTQDVPPAERPPAPPQSPITDKALEYKLVDLMKDDEVGDDERSAIWTLVQYLTRKAKTAQVNTAADK
jgi:hypothetical protein